MKHLGRLVTAFLIATGVTTIVEGQTARSAARRGASTTPAPAGCLPSIATLKRIAASEWARTKDSESVLSAVDAAIGRDAASFGEAIDFDAKGISMAVIFPQRAYRFDLSETIRKRLPVATATAVSTVVVRIHPTQIDAPNIERVIVERAGREVPALSNTLGPEMVVTRLGAKNTINSGTLTFPCSAFLPGAKVTITAIPSVGHNFTREFTARDLESLTGRKPPALKYARELIGNSKDAAIAALVEPWSMDESRLVFGTRSGAPLTLQVGRFGVVDAVSDESLLISDVLPPSVNGDPPTIPRPLSAPFDAIARCGDGLFIVMAVSNTCYGHTGVAEWYTRNISFRPPLPVPQLASSEESPTQAERVLLGKSEPAVRSILGDATLVSGNIWSYDTAVGTFRVEFSAGRASALRPKDFDLTELGTRQKR